MFGFDLEEIEGAPFAENGSEYRFHERKGIFLKKELPQAKHDFWWFVHNCIAHPLIGILPIKATFNFHDWTSHRIMAEPLNNKDDGHFK